MTIQDVALAAYTNLPDGMEYGLEGVHYYDPPNLTYPYGSYVVVVEVDAETGVWKVRRMVALDDCGVRINPMIVEGQIHGGLTEGFAMSSMQWITFDDDGNCIGSNFMDYLIPTAWETPRFELLETCVPSPHHPIGAKGVGESATVGSPAAYVNAVIDAVAHLGVRNIDMPVLPDRVWAAIQGARLRLAWTSTCSRVRSSCAGAREPFALATVVWRRAPSSGHVGSKAVIRADGTVEGWLGGACAEPTVVREALAAMADGQARLLFLGQPDELDRRTTDGMVTVPMACESEGALEIYLEPCCPSRRSWSSAARPRCSRSRRWRALLDWDVAVIDDGGDPADHPHPRARAHRRWTCRRSRHRAGHRRSWSRPRVTTTTSRSEAALATDAGYIGLVADREARVADPGAAPRARASAEEQLAPRRRAGRPRPRPHRQRRDRRRGARRPGGPARPGQLAGTTAVRKRATAIDPVCGMTVAVDDAKHHLAHEGTDYYFCSPGCLAAFETDPGRYAITG